MKAVVTNKKGEYIYTIENVVAVNYVENNLIIVSIEDGIASTHTYFAKEKIVAIA